MGVRRAHPQRLNDAISPCLAAVCEANSLGGVCRVHFSGPPIQADLFADAARFVLREMHQFVDGVVRRLAAGCGDESIADGIIQFGQLFEREQLHHFEHLLFNVGVVIHKQRSNVDPSNPKEQAGFALRASPA